MWPSGKKAAVSITYDDGHPSNLDMAIPDLEEFGFCGTFFVTPGIYSVTGRVSDWRNALLRGHEIGNHTWDHPCDTLSQYDEKTFAGTQTGYAEQWLNDNLCKDDERTYAYTCGITKLGADPGAQDRYLTLVRQTFLAARVAGGGPTSPAEVKAEPHLITASAVTHGIDNARPAIKYCQSAARRGGWAIMVFHAIVDGQPSAETETRRQVHRKILTFLANNQSDFWVAPFRTVYRHIERV